MLVLEKVSKTFVAGEAENADVPALSQVSLEVHKGEFVSLIGPSGCGKSTLINIVAGLVRDYEGAVRINGELLRGPHPSVGMVFQEESTFPWLTTLENVEFGLKMRGVDSATRRRKANDMLALVGLDGFAQRFPAELSGGMRQRVAIARALVLEPAILLMDEPFGSLDEQTRIVLGEELLRLQEQLHQTVVFVTHNLGESVQLSDRVVALTARPARIKHVLTIDLPRPRDSSIITSERYGQLVGELWALLREEALTTFGQREGGTAARFKGPATPTDA